MKTPTITIRVFYKDWKKLRQIIPADKNETIGIYFLKVIKWIEEKKNEL